MKYVTIGWVWLERTLNNIIREVNIQKPLQSASIAIEESPNGTLFKVVNTAGQPIAAVTDGGGGGGGPTTGGWVAVDVVDAACNRSTLYVWATTSPP